MFVAQYVPFNLLMFGISIKNIKLCKEKLKKKFSLEKSKFLTQKLITALEGLSSGFVMCDFP